MRNGIIFLLTLACAIVFAAGGNLRAESKRELLKEKFAPGNFMQMQNTTLNDQITPSQSQSINELERQDRGAYRPAVNVFEQTVGEYAIYTSDYTATVEEEIAFIKAKITLEVFKKTGWVKIPLASSTAALKQATINNKPSYVLREGSQYVMLINKPGRYVLELAFFIKVNRERERGPGSVSFGVLPSPISILDVELEGSGAEIFVEPSIKIETEHTAKQTLATVVLPFTQQVTVRWSKAVAKETIPEVVLEPKIYADTNTLVSISDGVARCFSTINFSILQSEISNMKIVFPQDVGILEVRGPQLRDWKAKASDSGQTLDVYLTYGVKGTYQLGVLYERTVGAGSVTAAIPDVFVVGAERQRGFAGIEARTNIELAFNTLEGATVIDVKELPQDIWKQAQNPILLAYKHLKHPYNVVVDVTKHQEIPVLVAAIDSANYVTLLTREGKVLTKATYNMRNNVKQFVRLGLPQEATLWSCFVSGKPVKPAKDTKGKILIPLEKSQVQGEALTQFPVEVVYMTTKPKLKSLGELSLQLPQVDIPASELFWSLFLPERYNYCRFRGDVEKSTRRMFAVFDQPSGIGQLMEKSQSMPKRKLTLSRSEASYQSQLDYEEATWKDFSTSAVSKGVLPIRIDIPQQGRVYRFSKLLVTNESPWLNVLYLPRVPGVIKLFAFIACVFLGIGMIIRRFSRKSA